ncbi:MAG: helix-turn-helix transcriptional regulator, partial [Solirubrobacteraceae bacterium]
LQAELHLAQHRPEESLADALEAGAAFDQLFPGAAATATRWRSSAAAAHLALGRPEAALEVIEPELQQGRELGVTSTAIRALRLKGLALGGEAGITVLREAVALGDGSGPRLEHVRALVDLGAALRRANRRAAAREPLTRGLDLSNRGGASALAAQAHTELIASGARPRRLAFSGIDSLTVSQRRVAELAARGLTTRQIAEALYVTPKTVEFHLRQAYQKLDVSSRAELADRFAGAGER